MATTTSDLTAAIDELAQLLRVDGVTLSVLAMDATAPSVELSVGFDGVDCEDCVLPPDRLHDTVAAKLSRSAGRPVTVVVHDPRRDDMVGDAVVRVQPTRIDVLDPTGVAPYFGEPDPGPDAGPLAGKTVGIRHDVLWASFDWTVEEWIAGLERAGAKVLTFKRTQGQLGDDLARANAAWEAILAEADVAFSGLGNCGSCTSWSVRDALTAASKGIATAVVATEHFEPLARILAAEGGRPGLRVMVLPYPYDTLSEEEVRAHARNLFPRLLETLGALA